MNKDIKENSTKNEIDNLDAKTILKNVYKKELDCKKNILECIECLNQIKKQNLPQNKIQEVYTIVYKSIDNMAKVVKPNTIMFFKNKLKAQLGKLVSEKDPKPVNYFIKFFEEAYPKNNRRKDFTWAIMDINKITDEQIWTTLTYINRRYLNDELEITNNEKRDILKVIDILVKRNNIKYINQLKSLENVLNLLNIKIVLVKDKFKIKNIK